jgi:hypothetical protein
VPQTSDIIAADRRQLHCPWELKAGLPARLRRLGRPGWLFFRRSFALPATEAKDLQADLFRICAVVEGDRLSCWGSLFPLRFALGAFPGQARLMLARGRVAFAAFIFPKSEICLPPAALRA